MHPGWQLTDDDLYLFNEGRHLQLAEKLGAHPSEQDGTAGFAFAVWAPNAEQVHVIGDFTDWQAAPRPLSPVGQSGIWAGFVPGVTHGQRYMFQIQSRVAGYRVVKADPLARFAEQAPGQASLTWDLSYAWQDHSFMERRAAYNALSAPMSIYEVHLGSWMRIPEEGNRFLSYRELAPRLRDYVRRLGYTHVELLPVMEHPFYGSWGYQVSGYFAPTSRYGTPQDLMFLIDTLHQAGIGVLLDWVPSHFPSDEFALGFFDGTHLYEHQDPRKGLHPDWGSLIFNYDRNEVRSFLLSNALFWLSHYHFDGLRVDAVASMLYLDYGRKPGEWEPNIHGGHENLSAISFLRTLNREVYHHFPDVQMIAEESTSWPGVTHKADEGGLGFGMKWDMGFMHDTLSYLAKDPIYRPHHHNQLTFRSLYAHSENFVLALSHDEVVHQKGTLLEKMSGDPWQKRANLRLLYAYQFALPGKKLMFMGDELGSTREWNHDRSLDWHLLADPVHAGITQLVCDLNHLYRQEPALHAQDFSKDGFLWLSADDAAHSVLTFLRRDVTPAAGFWESSSEISTQLTTEIKAELPGQPIPEPTSATPNPEPVPSSEEVVLVACNFTPIPRPGYRIGVPQLGYYRELLNSDAAVYGGSGLGNLGGVVAEAVPWHGQPASISVLLPPLSVLYWKRAIAP